MTRPAKEIYSQAAERYDDTYYAGELSDNMDEEYLAMMEEFCERVEKGRILDAGCGPGRLPDHFRDKGFDVVGIDAAEGMIEYAREQVGGEFHLMDIRDLDFPDSSFDGIWCTSTIFFIEKEEMEEVLESFHEKLKEGGFLYVDFKEGDGRFVKEKWEGEMEEYRLKEEEARKMLEEAEFEIVSCAESTSPAGQKYMDFLCRREPKE